MGADGRVDGQLSVGERVNIICLDYETFFSDDYTLSKMTNEAYLRDPRFEVHGCAVRTPDGTISWLDQTRFRHWAAGVNWQQFAILCHHGQFDAAILSWHYGIKPKVILDTLSMARLLIGNHLSVGLDSLAKQFGLAAKTVPYNLFKGRHWAELPQSVQQEVAAGACHDVELTWQLFEILSKQLPPKEYVVIDQTIRMFSEPVLRADGNKLAEVWEREAKRKLDLLSDIGLTPPSPTVAQIEEAKSKLQSADQFAALLRSQGVEPETKTSPKGNEIYAFAKTDSFMKELADDDDPIIRGLAEARLGCKSTFKQSRAETLGWTASRGNMPVYLFYCGAHTTRWSGGDEVNYQNLDDELESCILPPEDHWAFAPDASQIECRLVNYLAGQWDKIDEFREKKDPYVGVASRFYNRNITKHDKHERQVGKVLELQCGFGSGAEKIRATLRNQAGITLDAAEAVRARDAYRDTHPEVVAYWGQCGRLLSRIAAGEPKQFGPFIAETGKLYIPGEPVMLYTLEYYRDEEDPSGHWRRKTRHGWQKMYGAKLCENLVQYAHRIIITDALVRLAKLGYRALSNKHDALWFAIKKDADAERHREIILTEMCRPPAWAPDLPLAAEGELKERFGK